MASCNNQSLLRPLVGIRCNLTHMTRTKSAFLNPSMTRLLSTQAAPPTKKVAHSIPTPILAQIAKLAPLQSRQSSTLSHLTPKQDWQSHFRKAYYGNLSIDASQRTSQNVPQPSHITSPEKSPLYSAWTYPLFIWGLIALNGAVLFAFTYAKHLSDQGHPTMLRFMESNFNANYLDGKYWTLVTNILTHKDLYNYLFSMLSFVYIAPPLVTLLGPITFLGVYIGAGVAAGIGSIWWNQSEFRQKRIDARQAFLAAKKKDGDVVGSAEVRGQGAAVSQLALASILAMVDSRSKMLLIIFPIYTRILVPICALAPILLLTSPPQLNNTKVDLDPTYTTTAILFGLIYWKLGLRGKQFA